MIFPYVQKYRNKIGQLDTEKMHSIKHAPNAVARWTDAVNTNMEPVNVRT